MAKFIDLGGVMLMSAFLSVGLLYGLWAPDIELSELRTRYGASSQHVVMVDGLNVQYKDTGPQDAPRCFVVAWLWFKLANLGSVGCSIREAIQGHQIGFAWVWPHRP